jgi:hypothetical protein
MHISAAKAASKQEEPKKTWGTRQKSSPFIRKKGCFFVGPSCFEAALE